jgi:predicted dehydrogenase
MIAEVADLDFVTIGTGLHLHYPMLTQALGAGCHAVLAKPSTVIIQQLDEMIHAAESTGRTVAVDFQHVYSSHTQRLKKMRIDGALGDIRDIVVKAVWARPETYYARNRWAGKRRLEGDYVLDGPMNNPHAHYLTNAFYFASNEAYGYARPTEVRAELYRAKPIEGEDTVCMRVETDTGIPVYAYLSLARPAGENITEIEVNGERGSARWHVADLEVRMQGSEPELHKGAKGRSRRTIDWFLECLEGTRERPLCTLEDTRSHVLCTNGAYESSKEISDIPKEHIQVETVAQPSGEVRNICIPGIIDMIDRAAAERSLFSEIGIPWARRTTPFSLAGYRSFELFREEGTGGR